MANENGPAVMVDSRRAIDRLWAGAIAIGILGGVAEAAGGVAGGPDWPSRSVRAVRPLFRPSAEGTIGSWYTSGLLLLCAALLLAIAWVTASRGGPDHRRWRALGWIFLFLSCDEAVSLHERIGDWVQSLAAGDGPLLWEWVGPYTVFALIVAALYLPFLRRLPTSTRHRIVLAGAVYLGGALGLEVIQAEVVSDRGPGTNLVASLAVLEEFLEMAGALLFVQALLQHLTELATVRVTLTQPAAAASEPTPPMLTADSPRNDRPTVSPPPDWTAGSVAKATPNGDRRLRRARRSSRAP